MATTCPSSPQIQLEESWKKVLAPEFQKEYMKNLKAFLVQEIHNKKVIYPPGKEIFAALNLTPLNKVEVVVIGQDPYHGPNQAHGLAFSVRPKIPPPPSLVNIFKELHQDVGIPIPKHGHLNHWAEQGVLLLNTVLTVEAGKAHSHQNKGWEQLTDQIVDILNNEKEHLVFLLWGTPAQKKGARVNTRRHLVLKAVHPSPLSAHRGFFGCKHFSKTNQYLRQHGKKEIDWALPPVP